MNGRFFSRVKKWNIRKRKTAGQTAFFFFYDLGQIAFEFSMLCECRDDIQALMGRELSRRGIAVKTVEIDMHPWVITVQDKV